MLPTYFADLNTWREEVLQTAAQLTHDQAGLWALAQQLCPQPLTAAAPTADLWGAHVTGQMLAEFAQHENLTEDDAQTLATVCVSLAQGVMRSNLPALERVLAGRHLALLGDPRRGVVPHTLKDFRALEFGYVPAGPFYQGETAQPAELAYDYWLARYPITNAQFALFVQAGGYQIERYWAEAQAAHYWSAQGFTAYRGEVCGGPYDYGWPFNLPNHPVVGVTWYEAMAFCSWLNERFGVYLPLHSKLSLPSEAEWEKAARGGCEIFLENKAIVRPLAGLMTPAKLTLQRNPAPDRIYPWVKDGATNKALAAAQDLEQEDRWPPKRFDMERANTLEARLRATNAVGCFAAGQSPYGVEELVGNVLEWSRSKPFIPWGSEASKRIEAINDDRLLRGGSWNDTQWLAHCAKSDAAYPLFHFVSYGFRVVVTQG